MDLHLLDAAPTGAEREAVDALLGAPAGWWDGGARASDDGHAIVGGGHAARQRRHLLLPTLLAIQGRVGWISEGALNYACLRLDVPPAEAWGVATFYALLATAPRAPRVLHVCDDIACRARSAATIAALERAHGPSAEHAPAGDHARADGDGAAWLRSPCLGLCEQAPAAFLTVAGEAPLERAFGDATPERALAALGGDLGAALVPRLPPPQHGDPALRLLQRVGVADPTSLDEYRVSGGYDALRRALAIGPEAVLREIADSRLLGRGGAAFPTARKWEAVARQPARPHYVVCNADESEPGTFKDRVLLEEDPFAIVEAMTIAGFAVGAERGFVYLRGEYPLAAERMANAIAAARARGLLGDDVMGRGMRFDLELRRGGGAYICGEETAIFNSIEGFRGEPRNKPPFPVQAGLFGRPTVVNNVETLANIPGIVLEGGAAVATIGTADSTGTKLFCVAGAVRRPGVYEVPFGPTLADLLALAGGPPEGRTLQAVLLGGAAGTFVGPDELDVPLTFEGARAARAAIGSGVVLAFDDTADLPDLLLRIAAFFRDESCGQCVPCRVGTVRQEEALHRLARGRPRGGVPAELALLEEIGTAMQDASICGLGQTAYGAVHSAVARLGVFTRSDGSGR